MKVDCFRGSSPPQIFLQTGDNEAELNRGQYFVVYSAERQEYRTKNWELWVQNLKVHTYNGKPWLDRSNALRASCWDFRWLYVLTEVLRRYNSTQCSTNFSNSLSSGSKFSSPIFAKLHTIIRRTRLFSHNRATLVSHAEHRLKAGSLILSLRRPLANHHTLARLGLFGTVRTDADSQDKQDQYSYHFWSTFTTVCIIAL